MHVCGCMLDQYLQQEIFPLKGNGKMLAVAIKIANTDGSEVFKQQVPVSSPAIRLFYTVVLTEWQALWYLLSMLRYLLQTDWAMAFYCSNDL